MVIPNHVHAIIEINREFIHDVGTGRDLSLHHGRDLSLHQDSRRKSAPCPYIWISYRMDRNPSLQHDPKWEISASRAYHKSLSFHTIENNILMLHHRKPNRLRGCNYAQDRFYFITTCVHDRVCVFGEVVANQMVLNECGMIADRQWRWLENQYPYIRIHIHMVMPNHVHAIIEINRELFHTWNHDVGTGRDLSLHHDSDLSLHHGPDLSLHHGPDPSLPHIKIKPLSELIGAYKTTSSKQIHLIQSPDGSYPYQSFCWQRSFHDRIIRSQTEYRRIVTYIDQNPLSWSQDEFYR